MIHTARKPTSITTRAWRRVRYYLKTFKKPILFFVVIMTLVIAWRLFPQIYVSHFLTQPPLLISAETSQEEKWSEEIRAIGTLAAINSVTLASEIGGIVKAIPVESGQFVKKGSPILQLNDDVERADLLRAEAAQKFSQASLTRSQKLTKGNVETVANLEQKQSKYSEDKASVEQAKAIIAKKNIIAPFDGIVGIRQINLGQYLQPGTPIITLTDPRHIYINFSVPERYRNLLKAGERILFKVDAFASQEFEGTIKTIDAQINEQTRNADVQGLYENTMLKLSPGMFADIRIILPQQEKVVTVSQTAIDYGLYGSAVYVLEEKKPTDTSQPRIDKDKPENKEYTVKRVSVQTGDVQKGRIVILSGLSAGQHIVSAGQLKLETGATVIISKNPAPVIPSQIPNE